MTEFDGLPLLRSPVAIAAFEGWNDAADASTAAVEHLEQVWQAREITTIDPEEFYDFQVSRPTITMAEGETRKIEWPTTRFMRGQPARHRPRRGADPRHRAEHALAHVLRADPRGLPQPRGEPRSCCWARCSPTCPYTRPLPISGIRVGAGGRREVQGRPDPLRRPDRHRRRAAGGRRPRRAWTPLSFWVHVPHYANNPPCPKATLALLHRLEDVLDLPVPMADLAEESDEWEKRVTGRRGAGRRAR